MGTKAPDTFRRPLCPPDPNWASGTALSGKKRLKKRRSNFKCPARNFVILLFAPLKGDRGECTGYLYVPDRTK